MKRFILPRVDSREFAHILAGLRMLQTDPMGRSFEDRLATVQAEIIESDGHHVLSDSEIDDLCERLNCE